MSKSTPEPVTTSPASTNSSSRLAILRDRAHMFAQVRHFFSTKEVLEVDCPILSASASIDAHIDLITAHTQCSPTPCYLHSSPEYGMKRLLAEGIGDIYQLSHVFRDGESGKRHNPEFTMIEWYRQSFSYQQMIDETMDLITLFIGKQKRTQLSYRDALKQYANIDYVTMTEQQLLQVIQENNIPTYPQIEDEGKDALLNVLLGTLVEPHLGSDDSLCALTYYPATQAALAKTEQHNDEKVALRFEIYYQGLELANGYCELTDAAEQRQRFIESNNERVKLGKDAYPIDEHFLAALEKGIPDCSGVAVGFDRLMMLRHGITNIDKVIPFSPPLH